MKLDNMVYTKIGSNGIKKKRKKKRKKKEKKERDVNR